MADLGHSTTQQPQTPEAMCAAGEAAFLAHDYRTARSLLTAAAELGCARAMACLGLLLRDCYGVGDDSITTEATELLSGLTPTQVAAVMPPSPRSSPASGASRGATASRTASNGIGGSGGSGRSCSPGLSGPPVRIAKLSIASLMARQPLLSGVGDGTVMRSSTATSSASESAIDEDDDTAGVVGVAAPGATTTTTMTTMPSTSTTAVAVDGCSGAIEFGFDSGAVSPLSSARTTPTPPPASASTETTSTHHHHHHHHHHQQSQLRSIASLVTRDNSSSNNNNNRNNNSEFGLRGSYGGIESSLEEDELRLSTGSNGDLSMMMAVDATDHVQQQQQPPLDAMSVATRETTPQLNGLDTTPTTGVAPGVSSSSSSSSASSNSTATHDDVDIVTLDWQPLEHESVRWLERGTALSCPLSQHQLAVALRKGWGTVRDKQRAQNLITDAVTRVLELATANEAAVGRATSTMQQQQQQQHRQHDNNNESTAADDNASWCGTCVSSTLAVAELDWLLQYLKAFSYRVGFGCATDLPEARRIFLALAKRGIAVAQKHLAKMWLKGLGGAKNATKAVKWMTRAADQGHRAAQYDLAVMSERGQGCERDAARHYTLLEQAAKQGHGNALYACARRFKRACSDADPSFSLAKRLYTLASRAGNEHAQYNLALMFKRGEGGEINLTKARHLFELAAANGYPRARYNLAKMLANGEGGERDAATARRLYRKAARKGHADSKFNLALMYWKGLGGTQNHAEARRLFSELASAGDADACFSFACMLRSGDGGPKDLTRARELLQHAANAGFVRANCALASMLEKGRGGERDCKEAFRLRLLAAEHDNDLGQYRVAIMYEEGIGTSQNYAKAFQWYLIAAKSNGVKSPKATERAERMLRELRAPWSPHVHTRFPRAIQDQIGTLVRLSLFDEMSGLPRFPEALLWMLPPEILFEIAQEIVKSQRIDIAVASLS